MFGCHAKFSKADICFMEQLAWEEIVKVTFSIIQGIGIFTDMALKTKSSMAIILFHLYDLLKFISFRIMCPKSLHLCSRFWRDTSVSWHFICYYNGVFDPWKILQLLSIENMSSFSSSIFVTFHVLDIKRNGF